MYSLNDFQVNSRKCSMYFGCQAIIINKTIVNGEIPHSSSTFKKHNRQSEQFYFHQLNHQGPLIQCTLTHYKPSLDYQLPTQ